ncbi:MAG: putative toxin-antitoxin system toxin component, PIN family [Coriobacteriales bacterium]|nr:putative toxin-antitoxin system toxin component, PIN family [Coriobacteriales bacterium]
MTTVVLDTNIVVSALLNPLGQPGRVLKMVMDGEADLILTRDIEMEYRDVLSRPKFNFTPSLVKGVISYLCKKAHYLTPIPQKADFSRDPDDEVFYNLAISAGAILITGNIKDYPTNTSVVTAREFLQNYAKGADSAT